jgi:hypothetical protein
MDSEFVEHCMVNITRIHTKAVKQSYIRRMVENDATAIKQKLKRDYTAIIGRDREFIGYISFVIDIIQKTSKKGLNAYLKELCTIIVGIFEIWKFITNATEMKHG